MIRAFLGIALPEDLRAALAVQQFLLPLPRRVPPEDMHLTLVFLGEVPEAMLEAAHDGFAGLRAAPFDLALRGLGLLGGDRPRVAWAGVAAGPELSALQARAERLARVAGCPVAHRKFLPHVTLGRFAPPPLPDALRLERAIAEGAGFAAGPWTVRGLILWQSRLGGGGPRYQVLAEYPLDGG